MAELTVFAYRTGESRLHRMDARCKILCLILVGAASFQARIGPLAVLTGAALLSLFTLDIKIFQIWRQLRFFFCFLFFLTVLRLFSEPGEPLFSILWLDATYEGLRSGALVSLRLLSMAVLGLLFIATSRSAEIKAAAGWFFTPIPFVPEKKIATMLGLLIRLIPLIFGAMESVTLAQKARCIENRKNPFKRILRTTLPTFRQIFQTADRFVIAMEARCYNDDRTPHPLRFTRIDLAAFALTLSLCLLMVLL